MQIQMETITITTQNYETFSSISNLFIDYYMTEANGEFVKFYLYLIRLMNSGKALSVGEIADHFNVTENDICRAIKYWMKQGVLRLDYNQDKVLIGIILLPLKPKKSKTQTTSPLAKLALEAAAEADFKTSAPVSDIEDNVIPITQEKPLQRQAASIPKKASYDASVIMAKKDDEDFGQILYQLETYFDRNITQSDTEALLYIYEELHFSPDLLEYLVEFCVSIGKKSMRYIESVAINWYKAGIASVEDAKATAKNYNSIYVTVLKQLGIPRRVPTPIETAFIDTWYNDFCFNKNIIVEACKRAILARPHSANFNYVNSILENWHEQNVRRLSDIEELDKDWHATRKKASTKKAASRNQFNNYTQSTSDEVLDELETLFLKEINHS